MRGRARARSVARYGHSATADPSVSTAAAPKVSLTVDLSRYWQQGEFSDVDISLQVLSVSDHTNAPNQHDTAANDDSAVSSSSTGACDGRYREVAKFPGHQLVLGASPYFKAQLLRWQQHDSSTSSSQQKPTATLLLDSAEQEPAAIAVLQTMYGITTPPLHERLTDTQLIHMAAVADMVQVPEIAQYAVSSLQAVASRAGPFGLTDSAKALLSSLPAWPQALLSVLPTLASSIPLSLLIDVWHRSVASTAAAAQLAPAGAAEPSAGAEDGVRSPDVRFGSQAPRAAEDVEGLLQSQHGSYVQQLLVGALGVLGAVWADEQQRRVLLGLPLPAMQLLLSCSTLQVPSEDTVLFVAQAYVNHQPTAAQRTAAQAALAPLIRCPKLSTMWLMAMVTSADADELLLARYIPQITVLLRLQQMEAPDADLQQLLQQASGNGSEGGGVPPASWWMSARQTALSNAPSAQQQQAAPTSVFGRYRGFGEPLAASTAQAAAHPFESPEVASHSWSVQVSDLKAACQQASSSGNSVTLTSPGTTPPIKGLVWRLKLACVPEVHTGGGGCIFGPGAGAFSTDAGTAAAAAEMGSVGSKRRQGSTSSSAALGTGVYISGTSGNGSAGSSGDAGAVQGSLSGTAANSSDSSVTAASLGPLAAAAAALAAIEAEDKYLPVSLKLTAVPDNAPEGMLAHMRIQYDCGTHGGKGDFVGFCKDGWVVSDALGVGAMGRGWDAEEWTKRGLPAEGAFSLVLTVKPPLFKPSPTSIHIEKW